MGVETEVKIRLDGKIGFLRQLSCLKPQLIAERHFEDNLVLDFPDSRLSSRQCLLRIRIIPGTALLTFKGPPRHGGLFKTREELETRVADGDALLRVLERMGLSTRFRYQKYRREFRLGTGSGPAGEVHIALDETPIGVYAELEGSGPGIKKVARAMGIEQSQFLRDSYASLYIEFCRTRGLPVENMTFDSIRSKKAGGAKKRPLADRGRTRQAGTGLKGKEEA